MYNVFFTVVLLFSGTEHLTPFGGLFRSYVGHSRTTPGSHTYADTHVYTLAFTPTHLWVLPPARGLEGAPDPDSVIP